MKKLITLGCLLMVVAACKKPVPVETPVEPPPPPPPVKVADPVPEPVRQMTKNFSRVQFEYDSATITAQGKAALEANAAILSEHPSLSLEVQGHCDERGTTEYNMALGQRRAEAVRKVLTANGVASSRISTVSYGEERPLSGGGSETAWAENRRAEFKTKWPSTRDVGAEKAAVVGTVE